MSGTAVCACKLILFIHFFYSCKKKNDSPHRSLGQHPPALATALPRGQALALGDRHLRIGRYVDYFHRWPAAVNRKNQNNLKRISLLAVGKNSRRREMPTEDEQKSMEKREVAAWNRLVSACNLEIKRMHERNGIFLTAQGFLLAGFGVTLSAHVMVDPLFLLFVHVSICFIGCLTSLSTLCSVGTASWMHNVWSKRLDKLVNSASYITEENYFTFGCCEKWPAAIARIAPVICPGVLSVSWLVLFFVSIFFRIS
jgi:hypothetical protein